MLEKRAPWANLLSFFFFSTTKTYLVTYSRVLHNPRRWVAKLAFTGQLTHRRALKRNTRCDDRTENNLLVQLCCFSPFAFSSFFIGSSHQHRHLSLEFNGTVYPLVHSVVKLFLSPFTHGVLSLCYTIAAVEQSFFFFFPLLTCKKKKKLCVVALISRVLWHNDTHTHVHTHTKRE